MLAISNNYSINPQFRGKINDMTPKELLKFEQECPWGDPVRLETFTEKNMEKVHAYIRARILNGDEEATNAFLTVVKQWLDSLSPAELNKLKKGLNQIDKKFDKTV